MTRSKGGGTEPPPGGPDCTQLLWFFTTIERWAQVRAAGVQRVVVDLEVRDKARRQAGRDTQRNDHRVADIAAARAAGAAGVTCRIDAVGPATAGQVEAVLDAGADELLVPMVRSAAEVDAVLGMAAGRARVAVMVETDPAVRAVEELVARPVSRLYLGLLDLWIDRGGRHPFEALLDGTADRVAAGSAAAGVPFGFGGLTAPGRGTPLPVEHLVHEMARTGASWTFLRRSFERDAPGPLAGPAVAGITAALAVARRRSAEEVEADRAAAVAACSALPQAPWPT